MFNSSAVNVCTDTLADNNCTFGMKRGFGQGICRPYQQDRRGEILVPMRNGKLTAQEISGVPLNGLQLRYELVVSPSSHPDQIASSFSGKTLDLDRGHAVLAGRPLTSAIFSRTGIHWSETGEKRFSCGVIRFSPDRLRCTGFLTEGPTVKASTRYEIMGAVRSREEEFTTASGRKGKVKFGYIGGSPWKAPSQFIEIDGQDATPRATLEHVPGEGLRLHMAARPDPLRRIAPAPHDWIAGGSIPIDLSGGAASGLTEAIGSTRDQGGSPAGDVTMSVEDLATCDLSTSEGIGQQLVQYNLIWALEQKWGDVFFPLSHSGRPDLSGQPGRMDDIDPDAEWYNVRFAPAYIGMGLADSKGSSVTLTDQQILRLKYYLNVGVGLEFAYNWQTQYIALQAAEMASPALVTYADDTSGTNWAEELYNYLMGQDQMNSLINQIQTSTEAGMKQLDDYSTILTVLDPTGNYAQQYYAAVVSALTMSISIESSPWLDPDLPVWLPDYIQQFITNHFTGQTRPGDDDPGGQAVYDIAEDLSDAVSAFGSGVAFAEAFVAGAKVAPPSPELGVEAEYALTWLKANYPNWTGAGNSIMSLCMVGGLYCSIKAILDWPALNAQQQANTVVSLGQIMYTTIIGLPQIASSAAWITTMFGALVGRAYLATQNITDMISAIQNLISSWFIRGIFWLTRKFNAASKAIETAGTQIGKLFPGASTIVKVLGPVFAAAAFGISIWGLVNDIQSGAGGWNVFFDMVQTTMAGVVMAMALTSFIPGIDIVTSIIGIVAALIGAVVGFVQYLWNWLTQEDPPADDYMNNVVIPMIETLPDPPSDWTPMVTNPA